MMPTITVTVTLILTQAISSELKRLRTELSQAHALHQRLQHSLELIEARSSREAAKAAQTELELRAQIGEASTALETASETEAGLVSTCARVQAEASMSDECVAALRSSEAGLALRVTELEEELRVSAAQVGPIKAEHLLLMIA